MAIDRAKFFDGIRNGPFPGSLTAGQVSGVNVILDEWEKRKLTDLRHLAYMLATTYHETAHTMQPIKEIGKGRGHTYGVPDSKTGQAYYGRGFVQLTWKKNYDKLGKLLGQDLVADPDRALLPHVAAAIMFEGMIRGTFTGRKLIDYFGAGVDDPVNARRIINGLDKAQMVASYHKQFLADLKAADTKQATAPASLPVLTTAPVDKKDAAQGGGIVAGGGILAAAWHFMTGSPVVSTLLVLAIVAAAYWFLVRPVLRRMSALDEFYAKADEIEGGILGRLRLAAKGVKTLLWGRFLALAGIAGSLLQYADVIDFSAILPPILGIQATMYVPLVLLPLLGFVNNYLRKLNTTPAGSTDLALATEVQAPPLVPEAPDDLPEIVREMKKKRAVKSKKKARA